MHRKNLKGWNEVKTNDSWSVFKIMGEFVDGFENLSKIGPCVSIFGSARTKSDHPHYKLTTEVAEKIVELGIIGNLYINRDTVGAVVGSNPLGGHGI